MTIRGKAKISFVIGLGVLAFAAGTVIYVCPVFGYQPTEGSVLNSHINSCETGRINLHEPVIEYSYVVAGHRYTNDAYGPIDNDGTKDWAQGVVESYPVGPPCVVYYDKAAPGKSVLSRSLNGKTILILVGLTFLGFVHAAAGALVLLLPAATTCVKTNS